MRFGFGFGFGIAFVLAGCSSNPDVTPEGGTPDAAIDSTMSGDAAMEGAAMDAGADSSTPKFCTNETPQIVMGDGGLTVTTSHYQLYAETTPADATELSRLLEASVLGFQNWFERPIPAPPLEVKYYKDQPSWSAGLMADGITPPANAGGYYAPSTKTSYLFKQGNVYYSHVLLVHEAMHQFHFLTRLMVPQAPFWYVEGHAEYLSRHDWDGSCVSLGVMSLLSYEDLPKQGLGEGNIDFGGVINGSIQGTRADAWAIFRELDTSALQPKFKMFRDAFDANMSPNFSNIVAPVSMFDTTLDAWLPTAVAQEPMTPIYAGWIHVGPHALLVDSPVYLTLAIVKAKPNHFEAKLELPQSNKWLVGVLVSYADNQNYLAVLHGNDGKVLTFTANGGQNTWNQIGTAPLPSGNLEVFSIDHANGMAKVTFNGAMLSVSASNPRVGLAASDMTGRIIDIDWK